MGASVFLRVLARDLRPGHVRKFCSAVEKHAGLIRDPRHEDRALQVKPP